MRSLTGWISRSAYTVGGGVAMGLETGDALAAGLAPAIAADGEGILKGMDAFVAGNQHA